MIVVSISGCKNRERLGRTKVKVHDISFNFMTSKAKIKYADGTSAYTFTANFRVAQDSVIWATVSKAGFTLARVRISTDSVYVVNKFQREYYGYRIDEFNELIGFELDYNMVEDLFLGNLIVTPSKTDRVVKDSSTYLLISTRTPYIFKNKIDPKAGELKRLQIESEPFPNDSITVTYTDFKDRFPHHNHVTIHTEQKDSLQLVVDVKHSKVKFKDTKLSYPLGIKADYVKKN
jgi:hypothetical protein